jgi:hypothetical protein
MMRTRLKHNLVKYKPILDQLDRQTPRNEAEAEDFGWTVDRYVYPWVAYLGPRFDPERTVRIHTPEWKP